MAWTWWDDFDKRLCGKWKSEEFEINSQKTVIFLQIGFDGQAGAKVSHCINGETLNSEVLYVEYSYNSLYFFDNDREHRMEYVFRLNPENDDLAKCNFSVVDCFGIGGKFEKDLEFTQLTPLSCEEKRIHRLNRITAKDAGRIDILREYAEYGDADVRMDVEYKFDERENMLDLIEKYRLDELVKGKSDIDTAVALMNWLCSRCKHGNPSGGLASVKTPQALIDFADKNGSETNCRGLSLILSQLIRAYGIKAFHITCMPYEEPFYDCHVVVCVYCESLGKSVMLDPTNNLYLKNNNGEAIGADEFRDILINGGGVYVNDDAAYGGIKVDTQEYCAYMAKNLFRIERYRMNGYGIDGKEGKIILVPEKYLRNECKNFDEKTQAVLTSSKENFWKM